MTSYGRHCLVVRSLGPIRRTDQDGEGLTTSGPGELRKLYQNSSFHPPQIYLTNR